MPDIWDSSLYDDRHSFVWKSGGDLIGLLNPKPGERILDLGCGTGHLTAQIAGRGAAVIGMDSSASMIAQARQNYPKIAFMLGDARELRFDEPFDGVFSNAVLHWIREPARVIDAVALALKPQGRFVLEMGGKGNNALIVAAVESIQRAHGYEPRLPWFYPSAAEYATLLERGGFEIETLWTFPRWTKLDHPERGLREWLEMFGALWFEDVPAQERGGLIAEIEDRLRPALYRDGSWWADYHRLRVVAKKING